VAWNTLRDERFFGSMGGMGRIYYTAISRYALDHGITDEHFVTFVYVIDDEFIAWSAEEAAKNAPPTGNNNG
jgi:hypothetical protein